MVPRNDLTPGSLPVQSIGTSVGVEWLDEMEEFTPEELQQVRSTSVTDLGNWISDAFKRVKGAVSDAFKSPLLNVALTLGTGGAFGGQLAGFLKTSQVGSILKTGSLVGQLSSAGKAQLFSANPTATTDAKTQNQVLSQQLTAVSETISDIPKKYIIDVPGQPRLVLWLTDREAIIRGLTPYQV